MLGSQATTSATVTHRHHGPQVLATRTASIRKRSTPRGWSLRIRSRHRPFIKGFNQPVHQVNHHPCVWVLISGRSDRHEGRHDNSPDPPNHTACEWVPTAAVAAVEAPA